MMDKLKNILIRLWFLIPPLVLTLWCIVMIHSFLDIQDSGAMLFNTSLLMCLLSAWLAWFHSQKHSSKDKSKATVAMLFLIPLMILCMIEVPNQNLLSTMVPLIVFVNYLIAFSVVLLMWALSGSWCFAFRSTAVITLCLSIACFYLNRFKGSPLLPWDFLSIGTAMTVAGSFKYEIGYEILFSFSMFLLIWHLSAYVSPKSKRKVYRTGRAVCFSAIVGLSNLYYAHGFMNLANPDFFSQTRGYNTHGLLEAFLENTRYLTSTEPAGYDESTVEQNMIHFINSEDQISDDLQGNTDPNVSDPNIIVIMNEALSDLSVAGDLQLDYDPLSYMNSLKNKENVISGNCYVSTIGTGTSNTEYEFLTGNSMAFLPSGSNAYQLYVKNRTDSLASLLSSQGYSTDILHPYYKGNWNRPAVYERFGVETYTAMEDLNMTDNDLLGEFASDEYNYSELIKLYEQKDPDKPFFMFNITMQNHSPYDYEDQSEFAPLVTIENMEGDYPLAIQYLSRLKFSDQAFQYLIEYFEKQSEPTIILMFGDHQPFLEDGFYEELMGKPLAELEAEENQNRFITRFVMWANYDIPEGWIDQISVNYLSSLLAECTNTKKTDYQKFLTSLYKQVPVVSALGCIDHDGNYFTYENSGDYSEILNTYDCMTYRILNNNKE